MYTSVRGSPRLRNPAHAHVDFRNLIPGRVVHDPGLGEVEDPLENPDRLGGAAAVKSWAGLRKLSRPWSGRRRPSGRRKRENCWGSCASLFGSAWNTRTICHVRNTENALLAALTISKRKRPLASPPFICPGCWNGTGLTGSISLPATFLRIFLQNMD